MLKKLYVSYPKHYNDLRAKWDPTGEYNRRFEVYLREEQFNAIPNERPGAYDYDRDQTQVNIQRLPPQQQTQTQQQAQFTKPPNQNKIVVPLSDIQTTSAPQITQVRDYICNAIDSNNEDY